MDISLTKASSTLILEQETSRSCTKYDQSGNCSDCKDNKIGYLSNCYDGLKYCKKQMGTICVVCEDEYSLVDGACVNECGLFL